MVSISVLGGLLSALSWGTGDFFGGMLSKRAHAASVTLASGALGAIVMMVVAVLRQEPWPASGAVLWAALGGVAGAAGLLLLYKGLSTGVMGIVAPVSGIVGVALPILVAALTLGLPSPLQVAGFALALAAVWLLAGGSVHGMRCSMLALPVGAGLGFGAFFVLMAQGGSEGFFWPLAIARTASALALFPYARLQGAPVILNRALLPSAAAVALFDTGGNLFYLLAAQWGRLDTAAVLSSLYPAMTVALAWIVLEEQLSRPQWAGVVAALAAIPLLVG